MEKQRESAPLYQKLFEIQATKLQNKLVKVTGDSNAHVAYKELDFTLGPVFGNVTNVANPTNAVGQVVGLLENNKAYCRIFINQEVFHIHASYLQEVKTIKDLPQ